MLSKRYSVGTVISANTFSSLGDSDKANITTLTFTDAQKDKKYYYCRENYTVGENTEGVTVTSVDVTGGVSGTYSNGQSVPVGLVITEANFNSLPNYQTNFSIHGIATSRRIRLSPSFTSITTKRATLLVHTSHLSASVTW